VQSTPVCNAAPRTKVLSATYTVMIIGEMVHELSDRQFLSNCFLLDCLRFSPPCFCSHVLILLLGLLASFTAASA
jgi:hypothetical protein